MIRGFYKICFLILTLSLTSCISRLSRPAISGTVLDYKNQPVQGCKIGETVTDAKGKFYLKEIRYNQFLLFEMFQMEAPPLHFEEKIEKVGYQPIDVYGHSTFGGGQAKGAHYKLDTIYLKKIGETVSPIDVLFTDWVFKANKDLDSLYGINKNFNQQNSSLSDGGKFYSEMTYNLNPRYEAAKPRDTAWIIEGYNLETTCYLKFNADGKFSSKVVKEYKNPWKIRLIYDNRTERQSISLPNDTLISRGSFKLSNSEIQFLNGFKKPNTTYKIDTIDRDCIILTLKK